MTMSSRKGKAAKPYYNELNTELDNIGTNFLGRLEGPYPVAIKCW